MSERPTFSRTPRKALDAQERARLIAEMLGEEPPLTNRKDTAPPHAPEANPFDALDALDAAAPVETRSAEAEGEDDRATTTSSEDEFEALLSEVEKAELRDLEETIEQDASEDRDYLAEDFAALEEGAQEPQPELPRKAERLPPLVLNSDDAAEDGLEEDGFAEDSVEAEIPLEQGPAEDTPLSQAAPDEPLPPMAPPAPSRAKLRNAYEAAALPARTDEPADKWDMLEMIPVDVPHLNENLVITASREEPAHGAFDVLRTRLVQTLLEHGWKRVAVTSPSRNCGKTFTSVNLAISLSRYESSRTILLDLDMRNPSVAEVIGDTRPGKMGDFLRGIIPPEELLVRFEPNALNIGGSLAIGTNDAVEPYAAELAQDPVTRKSLERMMEEMSPDIVIFDMPPALAFDDVIAFRPHFDGILMVVGGGETRPEEVREVMRRLGDDVPLLGVVLNQAEGEDGSDYSYGY